MKKKILGVIMICLVVVGVLLVVHTKNKEHIAIKTESFEKKIISITNYDDFKKLVRKEDLEVYYSEDKTVASAMNFNFLASPSEMTINFDSKENINSFHIYIPLCDLSEVSGENSSASTEEEVYGLCKESINTFAKLFGVQYTEMLRLVTYEGDFLDIEEPGDMAPLLSEEAYINFAVRDESGYYYILRIITFESALEAEVIKYFDVTQYEDYVADISLYEEKEN